MIIQWPDLTYSEYFHPEINKVHLLKETEEKRFPLFSLQDHPVDSTIFHFQKK